DPVRFDTRGLESSVATECPKLTARQEVVRRPVPLIGPEVRAPVDTMVFPGESDDSPDVVMRLYEVDSSARSDHATQRLEDLGTLMEVVEALDDERRVDRSGRDRASKIERVRSDHIDVVYMLGGATVADDFLQVGHRLDRDYGAGPTRDERGEVAA